jgi:hypothetical protein
MLLWLKYLNLATSLFEKQHPMIQIFESCYIPI